MLFFETGGEEKKIERTSPPLAARTADSMLRKFQGRDFGLCSQWDVEGGRASEGGGTEEVTGDCR